ncbi:hypothetical protein [Streptomyces sp. Root369]|nr:hypothetical protein ASD08_15590 [Streptomyces sp. Root369]
MIATPTSPTSGVSIGLGWSGALKAPSIEDADVLRSISRRALWLSAAIVDAANRGRPNSSGVKVGGPQASSASMVDIMVAL